MKTTHARLAVLAFGLFVLLGCVSERSATILPTSASVKGMSIVAREDIQTLLSFFPGFESQPSGRLSTGGWPADCVISLHYPGGSTRTIAVAGARWSAGGDYATIQGDFAGFLEEIRKKQ